MSTDFRPLKEIAARDLFDGRLEEFNVRENVRRGTTERERYLTDGRNYLWVFIGDDGFVHSFTRWMPNGDPGKILNALANVFDTDIISEYEPQYWGFDTQEEWDAAMERFAAENHMAQIARTLVKKDPTLALPENKDKLRSEVELIFDLGFC